jgi:hypothetical protein
MCGFAGVRACVCAGVCVNVCMSSRYLFLLVSVDTTVNSVSIHRLTCLPVRCPQGLSHSPFVH